MSIIGIVLIVICLLGLIGLIILIVGEKRMNYQKESRRMPLRGKRAFATISKLLFRVHFQKIIQEMSLNKIMVGANMLLVLITGISAIIANESVSIANKQFEISNKLFIGQNKPLIDVSPVGIFQNESGDQATTVFSIVNYSGFASHNVGLDLKYGDNKNSMWILEWRKARTEKQEKKVKDGIVAKAFYRSAPPAMFSKIESGETKKDDRGISGALNIENSVCCKECDSLPVLIRVTWENSNGHVFDEIHRYRLLCSRDDESGFLGVGRSLTFIPEGIVSQKNSERKN